MDKLALALKILQGLNLATPQIAGIFSAIRKGRAAGKTDVEIQDESMRIALDTDAITERDMGDQP